VNCRLRRQFQKTQKTDFNAATGKQIAAFSYIYSISNEGPGCGLLLRTGPSAFSREGGGSRDLNAVLDFRFVKTKNTHAVLACGSTVLPCLPGRHGKED
jgi:hypothetical protein